MTKREALQSLITFEVKDDLIDKVLLDEGINGDDQYTTADREQVELAFAELLLFVANSPDFSEGDLSMTIKSGELLNLRRTILKRWGYEDDNEPMITGEQIW